TQRLAVEVGSRLEDCIHEEVEGKTLLRWLSILWSMQVKTSAHRASPLAFTSEHQSRMCGAIREALRGDDPGERYDALIALHGAPPQSRQNDPDSPPHEGDLLRL